MKYYGLMNLIENDKKGTFHSVVWDKKLKTKKGCTDIIEKRTRAKAVRLGVSYENMQKVKELNGIDEETGKAIHQSLPWGEWENYPYTIKHKDNYYLRMALADNTQFETEYYRNGVKVCKEDVINDCLASEFSNKKPNTVITVNIDNILHVK